MIKLKSKMLKRVDQCDQIGRFWKFLATNSLSKVAQKIVDYWLFVKKIN